MNGSTENRAWDAPEKSARRDAALNLGTARKMLPLVAHIVADVVEANQCLAALVPEQAHLDRRRHSLDWAGRSRRYRVREEVADFESRLQAAQSELERLGIHLLDPLRGRVGLPTVVNGHLAFFSWMPGDEGLRYWHFASEQVRRPIPATWKETGEVRLVSNKS